MADRGENIDYELITRYLAGETMPSENGEVENWIGSSPENQQTFAQLKTLWDTTGRIIPHAEADVDVDRAWSQFRRRVVQEKEVMQKADQKTHSLGYYLTRAAAVFIVGVLSYFLYRNVVNTGQKTVILAAAQQPVTDTLADGSVISLNAHSQLTYPKAFAGDTRNVSLKGEAYFQVKHNPQKPFSIGIRGATVTVLGTSFYVSDYDSIQEIKVGVAEGRVEVKLASADKPVVLEKGESISVDKSSGKISSQPYKPNEVFWKTRTLIFQNERLGDVFQTLEKYYNIDIETPNTKILDCRLTAKFYDEDISRIFDIINTNFNLTSENEDHRFIVSGDGCN